MPILAQMQRTIRRGDSRDLFFGAFWIGLAVLIFFAPVVMGLQSLAEAVPAFYSAPSPTPQFKTLWQVDGATYTVDSIPLIRASVDMIRRGEAPLWAPSTGGGQPLASNLMNGLYYPLRLAFFFVWDGAHAFDWYILLRFFIAGLGMFVYLRAIDIRRIMALWGGLAYAFSGYFILYLTYPFLDIDALLPWALWAVEGYFRAPAARQAALLGFLAAMLIVIGHPQSTIVAALFLALYIIWKAARERVTLGDPARLGWRRFAYHLLLAAFITLLIAAPFIIEFLVSYTQGATVAQYAEKGLRSLPLTRLLHFLVTPTMLPEVALSGHLLDRFELIVPYFGLGVLALFLASLALRRKPFPLAPLYVWIGFVILKNIGFPLVQWLGSLPVLQQVGWYKAYGPLTAAVIICGAAAGEAILREGPATLRSRFFYRSAAVIPAIFLTVYFLAPAAFGRAYIPQLDLLTRAPELAAKISAAAQNLPPLMSGFILSALTEHGEYFTFLLFAEAAVFFALALLLIRRLLGSGNRERAAILFILLTSAELWWYMPKVRDGFRYLDSYAATPPYVEFLQKEMAARGAARVLPLGNLFAGYIGELVQIEKAQNTYAVKPRRYIAFTEVIAVHDAVANTITPDQLAEVPPKFFNAFNVRYFLTDTVLPSSPTRKLVYDRDIKIYENTQALPKAYVTYAARTAGSLEDAGRIFYDPSFSPDTVTVVEDGGALTLPLGSAHGFTPAAVTRSRPTRLEVVAETERDGILVLSELHYPGWQAYLDGAPVPIYPANVMFRGIFLPAGDHEVVFKYEPWWFWPSVTLSLLTLLAVAGALAAPLVRRRFLPLIQTKGV